MTVLFLFILSAGCLALYVAHVCLTATRKSQNPAAAPKEKQQLDLERLAGIWTQRSPTEMPAGNTNDEKSEKDSGASPASFQDPALSAFHAKYIRGRSGFPPRARSVAEGILEILDTEGGCPSVVDVNGETESHLDRDTYGRLAKVPLREHAVDTAEEMLRLVEPGPMTPMAVIAALGHDLGKIPGYRQDLYSLGDHPVISVTVLEKIPGFSDLSNRDDIVRAIRDHHRKPVDFFSMKLKEADQEARKKELTRSFSLNAENADEQPEPPDEEKQETAGTDPVKSRDYAGGDDDRDKKKNKPREIEIPWYDGQEILREIAGRINVCDEGRWEAFSMSNGYVYAQVGLMWTVAKTVARKRGDVSVLIGDADGELRANIIYSIVQRLKTEQNAIARGLIRDGFFSAPFIVKMRDGTLHPQAYYIPFNLEAFGVLPSELEVKKYGKVREIIDVTPKW